MSTEANVVNQYNLSGNRNFISLLANVAAVVPAKRRKNLSKVVGEEMAAQYAENDHPQIWIWKAFERIHLEAKRVDVRAGNGASGITIVNQETESAPYLALAIVDRGISRVSFVVDGDSDVRIRIFDLQK